MESSTKILSIQEEYKKVQSKTKYDDFSDCPKEVLASTLTLICDCVSRFAPQNSQYIASMQRILNTFPPGNSRALPHMAGVLNALHLAYTAGYFGTVEELVHAEVFADFIDMADYLFSEDYKDPAAVIMGSVLEEHLRQLCIANTIDTQHDGKPKKADLLNSDLARANVYNKLDQKSITSWLDLRNKAAHGKYSEYAKEQVGLQIEGIRNFITRVPA